MKNLFYIRIVTLFILNSSQSLISQEKTLTQGSSYAQSMEVFKENTLNLYSKYFSEYLLDENWIIRTEMLQSVTNEFNYIETPLLIKYKIVNDFSILFGPKVNVLKTFGDYKISWASTFGMEYKLNNNTTINARFNYLMSNEFENEAFKYNYQSGSKTSYSLGSRFKF